MQIHSNITMTDPTNSTDDTDILDLTNINNDICIYWEKQENAFCGIHCINNLLQSSYYNELDMAELAQQCYHQTLQLYNNNNNNSNDTINQQTTISNDYLDDNGNFSVEVLIKALNIFNVELINLQHTNAILYQQNPVLSDGYILHLYDHWIALRKTNNIWYNLNSLDPYGPEYMSNTYLSTYLATMQSNGFTALVVIGQLPNIIFKHNVLNSNIDRGKLYTHKQCIDNAKKPRKHKKQHIKTDNDMLQKAIAMSLNNNTFNSNNNNNDATNIGSADELDDDRQLQAVLAESMKDANNNSNNNNSNNVSSHYNDSYDDDLQRAIRMSMQQ